MTAPGAVTWNYDLSLCVYDMMSGSVRQLEKYTDDIWLIGATGGYCYFIMHDFDDELYALTGAFSEKSTMYRADAKTGNIVEIPMYGDYSSYAENEEDIRSINLPTLWEIIGDKLYWYEFQLEEYKVIHYTTDLDGKNQEFLDFGDDFTFSYLNKYHDGYLYYAGVELKMTQEEYEQLPMDERRIIANTNTLYRIPFGGGKSEFLADNIYSFVPCGDKIYYLIVEDEPVNLYPGNVGIVSYNLSGGKVYVMNSDGSDKKLLCETGHNLGSGIKESTGGFFEVKKIDGVDYIAFSFYIAPLEAVHEWETPLPRISPDTIIINGSTGEWTVVSVPE